MNGLNVCDHLKMQKFGGILPFVTLSQRVHYVFNLVPSEVMSNSNIRLNRLN